MPKNRNIWERCLNNWINDPLYEETTKNRQILDEDKRDMIFTDNTVHTARVLNNLYGDPIGTLIPTGFSKMFETPNGTMFYIQHENGKQQAICDNISYEEAIYNLNEYVAGME